MGNLLVRSVSGCLPFVGQGVEVDLQPVGFWRLLADCGWYGLRGLDVERRSKSNLVVVSRIGDRAVPQDYTRSRQHTAIKPATDFSASTG